MSEITEVVEGVTFLSVDQFKNEIGVTKFEVLRNPNTNKLFMTDGGSQNFKVQQSINGSLPMKMLIPNNNLDEACLVNVKPGAEVQFTL
jgi:hypothetical protein